jgi:putative membrane protein insertion efficiency factor
MRLHCLILSLILFVGIVNAGSIHAEQPTESAAVNAFTSPIRLFRKYVSPADGNRCPMSPTCSTYAMEATKRHGLLMGWIMACDRLLRCGRDELKQCTPLKVQNGIRCQDSVENNDFWWK